MDIEVLFPFPITLWDLGTREGQTLNPMMVKLDLNKARSFLSSDMNVNFPVKVRARCFFRFFFSSRFSDLK